MRLASLPWLLLLVSWALACGGRSDENGDDGGGSDVTGDECVCGPGACSPGYTAIPEPEACCFRCELDLSACEEQRRLYVEFRTQVMEDQMQSGSCATAEDCVLFEDRTGCSPSCGYAIPKSSMSSIDDRLNAYAEKNCNPECPPQPTPPCDPRPSPECVMGVCQ